MLVDLRHDRIARDGASCLDRRRRVGAILSTELLFLLPILLVLLLALLEFTFLINAETKVTLASREGARAAALGGSSDDVLAAITVVLGSNLAAQMQWEISYPNNEQTTGNPVQVSVAVPAKAVVPILIFGNLDAQTLTIQTQTTMIIE